jgi:hypothetical protein
MDDQASIETIAKLSRRNPAFGPFAFEVLYNGIRDSHILRRITHEYVVARGCLIGGVLSHPANSSSLKTP